MAALTFLIACGPLNAGNGARPQGFRLVTGELLLPTDGVIGRQVTGLQLASVGLLATAGEGGELVTEVDVATSNTFDPGVRTDEASFVVAVDSTMAFNLVLQVPSGSGQGPGEYQGVLTFDDGQGFSTTLIPAGTNDLELGVVEAYDLDPQRRDDNLLTVASGMSPLAQVDSDQDGVVDLLDDDDDDDGLTDSVDEDVAGDGLADALQRLSGLIDEDADGIADVFR